MNFCYDIDGTLLVTEYKDGSYTVIEKNEKRIQELLALKSKGHTIILHTGRHWNHIKITKQQLDEASIKYDSLVMGKPVADVYIDDRSIRPEECFKTFKNILEVDTNG